MASVGASKLICMHAVLYYFVDRGVSVNGAYYRVVLLSQLLLFAMCQVSDESKACYSFSH